MNLVDRFIQYKGLYNQGMNSIKADDFMKAIVAIKTTAIMNKKIYVGGNGGSASISDHLCCDFNKGTYIEHHNPLGAVSLSSNNSLITAIGNDISFDQIFSYQLKTMLQTNDLVILISSSGNSPNIVKAAQYVKERGEKLIGITGFDGGQLKNLCDISLHIPVKNYGVVEDCHQSIMHIISQHIREERGII